MLDETQRLSVLIEEELTKSHVTRGLRTKDTPKRAVRDEHGYTLGCESQHPYLYPLIYPYPQQGYGLIYGSEKINPYQYPWRVYPRVLFITVTY
jgi:hypothetical protein